MRVYRPPQMIARLYAARSKPLGPNVIDVRWPIDSLDSLSSAPILEVSGDMKAMQQSTSLLLR